MYQLKQPCYCFYVKNENLGGKALCQLKYQ